MATISSYIGDGVTRQYDLTFSYRSTESIGVRVGGIDVSFSFLTTARVELTAAPAAGTLVEVYRNTPVTDPDAVFQDGQILRGDDLNGAVGQVLNRAEELGSEMDALRTASVRVTPGEAPVVLPKASARAGQFLAFDANGGPVVAGGTGEDGSLRQDLAQESGAALIKTSSGDSVERAVAVDKVVDSVERFTPGEGPTWPYYNLTYERLRCGEPLNPIVPSAPADGFTSAFTREMYLGAGHEGGAEVGHFLLQVRGAPAADASNVNQNYVALQSFTSVTDSLGGTNLTMAGSKGQVFASGMIAVAYPGVTNLRNLTGCEVNVQASPGTSLAYKSGIQVVAMPDDKVQGSIYDAGLSLSSQTGSVGFRHGILFSSANGKPAVANTGTLIGVMDGGTAAYGLDLRGYVFTANAISTNGFSVDGSGNVSVASMVTLGSPTAASTVALRGKTSGATAGTHDQQIAFFGGNGAQGSGGISLDALQVQPAQSNFTELGVSGNGFKAVYTWLVHIPERTAASVPNAPAGAQTLFIDSSDHKLKRKDSNGTVTVIG
ncbi:phage tail fiber protein [Novosphingobium sp.]|uniref:phage tail fiber domain-containing protein n=1 Tax=Novosphingobium sp. TaxID=1874826 RepID=UPI003D6D4E33